MISSIKELPAIQSLIRSHAWQSFRHEITLRIGRRENSTFTGFLRLPTQFEALENPIMEYILSDRSDKEVNIIVIGCSNGAEAYTIASVLKNRNPRCAFRIAAYDIDRDMVTKARTAGYLEEEVLNNRVITEKFIRETFDIENRKYTVKESIARHVRFDWADALDRDLYRKVGTADIVFAQNFLLHMKPPAARKAFDNIYHLLNDRAAFFVDGIDLNIRRKETMGKKLIPLDYKIPQIHEEARRARGVGWPYQYWGLDEFREGKKDWKRWYATVFLK
jgi:chemotaxis protein methyltransferase CheR